MNKIEINKKKITLTILILTIIIILVGFVILIKEKLFSFKSNTNMVILGIIMVLVGISGIGYLSVKGDFGIEKK